MPKQSDNGKYIQNKKQNIIDNSYSANNSKSIFSSRNLAFIGMVIGMFMAILDIQIVASSLPVIGAGLSASSEELSWIQTAYIIAEVVVIPLTGFTAKLLSTRVSYVIAATGFTIMSIACALSSNLESIIIFRALQGFFGGAMIPTIFGIAYIIFTPEERPIVIAIIGAIVTLAPTLGPTLGGYITDILSWHFMFLLNVPTGILVIFLVNKYANFDKPDYSLLNNFDYLGVFLLITSLGSIQYILEEGAQKDWFDSNLILNLTIYSTIGIFLLIYHELKTEKPILDLYALKNSNFAIGCIITFILGVGLYGAIFLLPIFLGSEVIGLNTLQIGIIMAVMGISQFIAAPIAAIMTKQQVDKKLMMLLGITGYAYGCYANSFMTEQTRFYELIYPQLIRGFSLMFCFVPINDLSLGTLPKNRLQDASGLYNLMRNLGGAFGLAIINTKLSNNVIANKEILSSNLNSTDKYVQVTKENIEYFLIGKVNDPEKGAFSIINQILSGNSFIISINNIFAYLGFVFILGILLIPFMKNTYKND